MKVIITGSTGMVGEGVMHVCLENKDITEVLVINRKPCEVEHPKLKEIIHQDFFNFETIEKQISGYDACFFCLGISSVGVSKEVYFKMTYTLTMHVAGVLAKLNPKMVFCYISGAGTDSAEKGTGWAAVKGKTENDLQKLPFKKSYAFRPGFILPIEGLKRTHPYYKYITWLFPFGRSIYPSGFCKLTELATAMILVVQNGSDKSVLEGKDIIALAK
jgi:nucleoside-diphosphate-sugar epimerase